MVQHFSIDNSIEIVQLLGLNLDSSAVDFSFLLATTCAVIVLTSVVPTRLKGTLHAIAGELSKIPSASMRCIFSVSAVIEHSALFAGLALGQCNFCEKLIYCRILPK